MQPVAEGADAKAAALLASIAEDIPAHMREFVEEAIKEVCLVKLCCS